MPVLVLGIVAAACGSTDRPAGVGSSSWSAPDPPVECASGITIGFVPAGYAFVYNEGHETATFHVFQAGDGSQFEVGRQLPPPPYPTSGHQVTRAGRVFTVNGEVRVFEELANGTRIEVLSHNLDEATLLDVAESVIYDPTRDR